MTSVSINSMRASAFLLSMTTVGFAAGCDRGPTRVDLSQPWIEATPAAVGMDAQSLARATDHAAAIPRFRSLLVARKGRLILERYFAGADASTQFDVRSVTKS